jgi:hypothetical protein
MLYFEYSHNPEHWSRTMKARERTIVAVFFLAGTGIGAPADSSGSGGADTLQVDSEKVSESRQAAGIENDTIYTIRGRGAGARTPQRGEKDTVLVLTREGTNDFLGAMRTGRRNARQRGFGGALGPSPAVLAVSMRPVNELIRKTDLIDIGFSAQDYYETFITMGGIGYGAIGNGLRIGGAGRGGRRDLGHVSKDTVYYTLEVSVGYGGFMVEKALIRRNVNLFIGLMLGGGGLDVKLLKMTGRPLLNTEIDADEELSKSEANASFFLLETHGGFTYSMLSWLHLGADITLPCFFSGGGFKIGSRNGVTDAFFTVNPGIRLRVMFGNIG